MNKYNGDKMEPKEKLKLELQDPEFAAIFGADQARMQVALTFVVVHTGLSRDEMAQKMGVSKDYIAKLANGEVNPSIGKVGAMLARVGYRVVLSVEPSSI